MAQSFNGSSSASVLSASSAFNLLNGTFTVAAKFKTTATTDGTLVAKGCGSNSRGWALLIMASGIIRVMFKGSADGTMTMDRYGARTGLNDGAWHSVVMGCTTLSASQSGNTCDLNVDGEIDQASLTAGTSAYDGAATNALSSGVRNYGSTTTSWFNGLISDVAIWNTALTIDEKRAYYKGLSALKIRPASLLEYWPMTRELVGVKLGGITNSNVTVANGARRYS